MNRSRTASSAANIVVASIHPTDRFGSHVHALGGEVQLPHERGVTGSPADFTPVIDCEVAKSAEVVATAGVTPKWGSRLSFVTLSGPTTLGGCSRRGEGGPPVQRCVSSRPLRRAPS